MKRKQLLTLIFIISQTVLWAQPDFTLPSLRNTYQSSYINPAFTSKFKVSIGIPGISNIYVNNTRFGFTLGDVIDSKEDSLVNLNLFYTKIKGDAIGITTTQDVDLFHVSFPAGKFQFSIHSALKTQTTQAFSKDFIGFLVNGNTLSKGQTLDFKAFDINSISYVENGFSVARKFKKLTVGVRVKYLIGLALVQTSDLRFGIVTPASAFDPLIIKSGGTINTAGVPLFADSVTGQTRNSNQGTFNVSDLTKLQNSGFGFDAGFTYKIFPKLMIHASVVDLGGITWKANVYNYKLENVDVQYDGFSSVQLNSGTAQNAYTDSLIALLGQTTVTTNSFKTQLRTRYFAGADFNVTKHDVVGFLFQGQQISGKLVPAYTFSYTHSFGNFWDITSNYSIYNKTFANIGLGTSVKFGPLQFYVLSDDILLYIKPQTGNTVYLRLGFNIVLGKFNNKKSKQN